MKLTEIDFSALSTFLKESPPSEDCSLGLHALKDQIIVAMIKNGAFIEELGDVFNDILSAPDQHPVLIDYVSQYIPEYFAKRWQGRDSQDQELLLKSLYNLLDQQNTSLSGTALSALMALEKDYSSVDRSRIEEKAFQMATDNSLSQASRSQALRYLGAHSSKEGYDILESTVFSESQPVMLRMIAVRSLADHVMSLTEKRDELIARINTEILINSASDKRLLSAATAAHDILNNTQFQREK